MLNISTCVRINDLKRLDMRLFLLIYTILVKIYIYFPEITQVNRTRVDFFRNNRYENLKDRMPDQVPVLKGRRGWHSTPFLRAGNKEGVQSLKEVDVWRSSTFSAQGPDQSDKIVVYIAGEDVERGRE